MSAPIVAFYNHRRGVGTTSLVYNVACMLSELGRRTLVLDLDPQADLTAAFFGAALPEDEDRTIVGAVEPLVLGGEATRPATALAWSNHLSVIPGDIGLARLEEPLAARWLAGASTGERGSALPASSAFWQVARQAATMHDAELVLLDIGPNLGAVSRAALLASDFLIVPVVEDAVAGRALRDLGAAVRSWRAAWRRRLGDEQAASVELSPWPTGKMTPIGYVVRQHAFVLGRMTQSEVSRSEPMRSAYRTDLVGDADPVAEATDPDCLAVLKPFRSLVPMVREARRPVFLLTPADGAVGSHALAVQVAYKDYQRLTLEVLRRVGITP